ncbi:MAG: acyltransferase family protein [Candidatus Riflebacteria bacterium]|nr:acyltransferase family protein [Candidatus Riflebacteria bacterium]
MKPEDVGTPIAPVSPVALPGVRLDFVDNLRWVMIILVIGMHSAVTYSHLGRWYFMEDPIPDLPTKILFAAFQTFLQAFFMGFLFLIAGYFLPGAFDRKGFWKFLQDRAIRLGIPALFYMLVIHPVTVYWLLRNFDNSNLPSLIQGYGPYLSSGKFLRESGPMWFALALLFFSLVYGLIRLLARKAPNVQPDAALPDDSKIFGLVAVMGLSTFLIRIVQPIGTSVLNMQLCFFSQYVTLFIVGIVCSRQNLLLRIPYDFGMRWFVQSLSVGSLAWLAIIFGVGYTHSEDNLWGGFTWQSAAFSFWESFFCVGVCLGMVVLFRDKLNRQGPLAKWLSDNCFSVYLFHPPFLVAVTLCMRGFFAPKPVKFLVASLLGVVVTYLASSLVFRRIPFLKRVL